MMSEKPKFASGETNVLGAKEVKRIINDFSYFTSLRLGFLFPGNTTSSEVNDLYQEALTDFRALQELVNNRGGTVTVKPMDKHGMHVYRKNRNRETVRIEETLSSDNVFIGNQLSRDAKFGVECAVKLSKVDSQDGSEYAQSVSLSASGSGGSFEVVDFQHE